MLTIQCQCGEVFHADKSHVGRAIKCWKCGQILGIGGAPPASQEERPAPETPRTKRKDRQETQRKLQSLNKKTGVFISVSIGILLLSLLILNSSKLPLGGRGGQQNSATKIGPERETPTIEQSGRPSKSPQSVSAVPSEKFIAPIESEPLNPKHLKTGLSPFSGGIHSGKSDITIDNGTGTDAFVRVLRISDGNTQVIRSFSVCAEERYVAEHIPPGTYVLKVAFGVDWNPKIRRFNYRKSFTKTQTFTVDETTWTEKEEDGEVLRTRSSKLSITLHKVPHGNFQSRPISEDEFWQ